MTAVQPLHNFDFGRSINYI